MTRYQYAVRYRRRGWKSRQVRFFQSAEFAYRLVEKLRAIRVEGVELFLEPVRDYRFVLVLRGDDLGAEVEDTDPGRDGVPPLEPVARDAASERTAFQEVDYCQRAATQTSDAKATAYATERPKFR